jgi:hypothetical protein
MGSARASLSWCSAASSEEYSAFLSCQLRSEARGVAEYLPRGHQPTDEPEKRGAYILDPAPGRSDAEDRAPVGSGVR